MRQKILLLITLFILGISGFFSLNQAHAESSSFTTLRVVDRGTFNEYRYRITKEFFKLKEIFQVDSVIDKATANRILSYAREGYKYLPDNLINESNYSSLVTALKKGIKYPNNEVYYTAIKKGLNAYIENVDIQQVTGKIEAEPLVGNAPFTTTLRARVEDPSGSKFSSSAYTWWMDVGGKRKVIGTKPSISYTFNQEGSFIVFLDVKSSHRNANGHIDVLPYSGKVKIQVKEKIASVIFRVSGQRIPSNDEIKFSPEEASYGLIFDATSSVPSSGTKFLKTSWDFGNGIRKTYNGSPRIERVVYAQEGEYEAVMKLKTNQLDIIEKRFTVLVHKPIANISASQEEGFMGDKFVFKAVSHGGKKNLSYIWEIIDVEDDKIISKKTGSVFNHSFLKKGRYSIKLKITDAAGNSDVDTRSIYINSRAPIASFSSTIPLTHKPNEVFLDATSSFDPDFSDDGNLKYSWTIDGEKVNLAKPNENGSTGYYTFSTIGEHTVVLEVEDPDEIVSIKKQSVTVRSTLSLDFSSYPRVIQREGFIRFVANSPEAKFYEWNFGDGVKKGGSSDQIKHSYNKSGIFTVRLTVRGKDNKSNTLTKLVYVGDSKNPVAVIDMSKNQGFDFVKESEACNGNDAYLISRRDNITFSSLESINTDGNTNGLAVSWKIGKDKFSSSATQSMKFDELGCSEVKLTVKSIKDKTTDSQTIWVKVNNIKPTLTALKISPVDINSDPVVVNLGAIGANDKDGVIQSYLWYYTTDADSEPQDFRVTKSPSTNFVLPKVPGSYYFGVVLKDNNDEKVTSEDVIGKNSITLVGDNINTPLVDLKINDSSVLIGDEVVFTVDAVNVLGKSIEKNSKFSWDFDGDGFYEKETDEGSITHKYKKSGTFYPKVKVKHKGFSNTRTLTISVANKLVSEFSYISVGNKYVFLDKSQGVIDNIKWDLGDGNKKQNERNFIYAYEDKKSVHNVELTVAEGTKVKKSSQEVEKDFKNILKARKKGLNVFSYPVTNKDGIISIEEEESVFIYLGESKGEFSYYGIDYDIDTDSDVNGGKDDDVDNIHNSSYSSGDPDEIPLNNKRKQTIRMFLLDENLATIDSKDITIEKTYIIEQEAIDPTSIQFTGVSEAVKVKIEKLKIMISNLAQENRIKGMMYIQKLQENWEDDTEKTKTVLEFEGFLVDTGEEEVDDIITILESLLLEGKDIEEGVTQEKSIAFEALKALIPKEIQCKTTGSTCLELLTQKLEQIRDSSEVESNRAVGKEILEVIALDTSMSDKEKHDFKAIIKVLVYSGLDNIPEGEINQIGEEDSEHQVSTGDDDSIEEEDGKLVAFLKNIGWWAAGIIGVIILLMFVFWILDFLKNRKSGESFEDFVSDKTSGEDVLGEMVEVGSDPLEGESEKNDENKEEKTVSEPVGGLFSGEEKVVEEMKEQKETSSIPNTSEESIPDWLGGAEKKSVKNVVEHVDETKSTTKHEEEENVGISLSDPKDEVVLDTTSPIDEVKSFNLDSDTKVADETPDWLQDSLTDKLPKKEEVSEKEFLKQAPHAEEEIVEPEPVIIEDKEEKIDLENDVPDWLKGNDTDEVKTKGDSLVSESNDKENSEPFVDNKEITKDAGSNEGVTEDIPDWLQGSISSEKEENQEKQEDLKNTVKKKKNSHNQKTAKSQKNPAPKKNIVKEGKQKQQDDLQINSTSEDNIPDWLKGSLDNAETKKVEKIDDSQGGKVIETNAKDSKGQVDINPQKDSSKSAEGRLDDKDVPDWLKGSLDEEKVTENQENLEAKPKKKNTSNKRRALRRKNQAKKSQNTKNEVSNGAKKTTSPKNLSQDEEKGTGDKKEELWDDGMTIPDWLKTDDDK